MTATLYQRLGGADGIARLVDDVIAAHLNNPLVRPRYENVKDIETLKRVSREFFCAGSGGPETYTGRDMLAAHKGMNVSEQEFLAVTDDIVGAMNKNGIEEAAKKDVIAILYSLKEQIIRV
jgi:hemoglobin